MNTILHTNPAYPLLKVCGLTKAEDVELCNSLGIDFTGFIFAKKSPRCITIEDVLAMPSGKAKKVGVFVGMEASEVCEIMHYAKLDFAQLHSGESIEYCNAIGKDRVIKVLWPEKYSSQADLQNDCDIFSSQCAMFLMDAGTAGGGHGRALPWESLHGIRISLPWLLAGGITPENAPHAFEPLIPFGIAGLDVNSGIEASPGIKDHTALQRLVYWRKPYTERNTQ